MVSFYYRWEAGGLFPRMVAAITIGLVSFSIIKEIRPNKLAGEIGADLKPTLKKGAEIKVFWAFLWLLTLVLALGYTNYIVAISVFIFLSLKVYAGQNWLRSVVISTCAGGFIYLIFQVLLHTANL